MVVPTDDVAQEAHRNLRQIVGALRTGAETEVIVSNGESFDTLLHTSSQDADLVFLGMAPPSDGFRAYYENLQRRVAGLPTTVLVLAAEDLPFGEVLLPQEPMDEDPP